jgi:hypothetical protein
MRQEKLSGDARPLNEGISEAALFLRRIAEQLDAALEEDANDSLARDGVIRQALPLWGLAFKHRHCLSEPVRDLLNHILTCMTSPLAAQNDVALTQLHAVVFSLAQHLRGTTEKDVGSYVARLEEAGFDLTAAITTAPAVGLAERAA